jgi:hypothetical protein
MRAWLRESPGRQAPQHPLWGEWSVYQSKMAVALMEELHAYANEVAGKRVPLGANAGLLWPGHLQDYRTIDLFSAETDHHAAARRLSDTPIFAYRLADAVGRPYASTASGGDWAFIKEHNLPGLVRSWIALSYAAGHSLMAPHRQWCYTPEKGTHWYEGPAERFAPLYRFVRSNALLFDDFAAHADVGVVVPHASYRAEPAKWTALADRLAAANVGYRILLGGDRTVDHRIAARDVSACTLIVAPDRDKLQPADRAVVDARAARPGVVTTVDEALNRVRPAVGVRGAAVRAFARVARRQVVVHLVNTDYDPSADDVREITNVGVSLDLKALGVPGARIARLHAPGSTAVDLAVVDGRIVVPRLGLWAILLVR